MNTALKNPCEQVFCLYYNVMELPADNYILLSMVNTALRDKYGSLEIFCEEEGVDGEEIVRRLAALGYEYKNNAFVYAG